MGTGAGADRDWSSLWGLAPGIAFLNHGSFGACPRHVLAYQSRLRAAMEAEPVRFLYRELPQRLGEARSDLGAFLGADPDDLAFVPNATTGVNTVVRSLALSADDEVGAPPTTPTRPGATPSTWWPGGAGPGSGSPPPAPPGGRGRVVEAVAGGDHPRTRLALLTTPRTRPGWCCRSSGWCGSWPSEGSTRWSTGPTSPGMRRHLRRLGAAYYTGNAHKWLCAPKGAGFLHVRRDRQAGIRPLVISHGASSRRTDRLRFRLESMDRHPRPTAYLAIPESLRYMGGPCQAGGRC